MTTNHESNSRVVQDLMEKLHGASRLDINDGTVERQILVLPHGLAPHSIKKLLDEYRQAPERHRGTADLTELDSFIAHANVFKAEHSAIFADRDPEHPSLLAVFDYHSAGAPRFGEHRARYAFPLSEEWKAWTEQDGKPMGQAEFAVWLEDHLGTVPDPTTAKDGAKQFCALLGVSFASAQRLLELSRGLTVHVGARVAQHANIGSGEANLSFVTEHKDGEGKPLKVPGAFLLALQVFRGGALYHIPTRLRYRVNQGSVSWSFDLWRAADAFDLAIGEACDKAKTGTSLPLYYGTPEK